MNTSPQRLAIAYFATMAVFLALDAVWLSLMASRLYQPAIGHLMAPDVDWLAAALFYPLYILGLLVFAVRPALVEGRAAPALRLGALFGLIAYATYDLTNQATLRDWSWAVTLADLAWGAFVSGSAAGAAAWFTCRPGSRRSAR
ncbi:MAG: DUF2177 family protein [Hydrogenophaga sp.]|uniref:DUF2177 family protein n=1 Tax=Hydrogenophaga sp. TaxID=1904254 RepID=UPI0016930B29|nr:DUF2177 family protein [Hydrogenophaga sp.]NIM41457.1 DUF2177 family protein [Hydrogenophaga sp.]NIN26773.1 DUF2177 family protein [Hydrogenophaga sp.]NIN31472.1 DUF2177 family protein [Hydrogenophaga sp.]NIN55703.1 DUF2177 family protein [Hydrogenophaga sp.]NIO51866.1 DUF2177 family protein [Hydrogenophaga sp.]